MTGTNNRQTSRAKTPEIGHYLATGGYRTNYHDVGDGAPVLLIHGSGPGVSAWANWRLTIPALAESGRVIAPDMLGFGYTESPAGVRYETETWVAQILALLDGLGIDRVSVVGNSFGGAIALALATRHPNRVGRLVLMGAVGVFFQLTDGLDKVWGYTPSPVAMKKLLQIFAFNQEIATDELAEMRYRASIRDDVQERFAAMFPAPRQRWIEALAVDEERLRALPHETLIIHGRDDRIIPFAVSERLSELIPNSRLVPFDECGHWVQIEYAERFAGTLRNFLLAD